MNKKLATPFDAYNVVYRGTNGISPLVRVRFPNGYGASVLPEVLYPGTFELAVICFTSGATHTDGDFELDYGHPVAKGDVLRFLTEAGLITALNEIARTPAP